MIAYYCNTIRNIDFNKTRTFAKHTTLNISRILVDGISAEILTNEIYKHLIRITCITYVESILILCIKRGITIIEHRRTYRSYTITNHHAGKRNARPEHRRTYRSYAITNRHACKRRAIRERRRTYRGYAITNRHAGKRRAFTERIITYRSYAIGDNNRGNGFVVFKRILVNISNRKSFILGSDSYSLRSAYVAYYLGVGAIERYIVDQAVGIGDQAITHGADALIVEHVLGVLDTHIAVLTLLPVVGIIEGVGGVGVVNHRGLTIHLALSTVRAGLSAVSYRVAGGGRDNYNVLVVSLRAVLPLDHVTAEAGTVVERVLAILIAIAVVFPLAKAVIMLGKNGHVCTVNVRLLTLITVVVIVSVSVLARNNYVVNRSE